MAKYWLSESGIMQRIVKAGHHAGGVAECRMNRYVGDALAVDEDSRPSWSEARYPYRSAAFLTATFPMVCGLLANASGDSRRAATCATASSPFVSRCRAAAEIVWSPDVRLSNYYYRTICERVTRYRRGDDLTSHAWHMYQFEIRPPMGETSRPLRTQAETAQNDIGTPAAGCRT
jgi:hypothetical protein